MVPLGEEPVFVPRDRLGRVHSRARVRRPEPAVDALVVALIRVIQTRAGIAEVGPKLLPAVRCAGALIDFLLRTRHDNGAWHVRSRAPKVQPYFESGFPFGDDQWISAAGTAWATIALASAFDPGTDNVTRTQVTYARKK